MDILLLQMERKPATETLVRLSKQMNVDVLAIQAWFRARRVKDKRAQSRIHRLILLGVIVAAVAGA